jgi:hypothetical protein
MGVLDKDNCFEHFVSKIQIWYIQSNQFLVPDEIANNQIANSFTPHEQKARRKKKIHGGGGFGLHVSLSFMKGFESKIVIYCH